MGFLSSGPLDVAGAVARVSRPDRGGVATFVGWYAMKVATGFVGRVGFGLWFLLVTIGMGFGALNEVVEFAAVLLIPDTNVGGYTNTGWDLVSNLVGCVIAATAIAWGQRGKATTPAPP